MCTKALGVPLFPLEASLATSPAPCLVVSSLILFFLHSCFIKFLFIFIPEPGSATHSLPVSLFLHIPRLICPLGALVSHPHLSYSSSLASQPRFDSPPQPAVTLSFEFAVIVIPFPRLAPSFVVRLRVVRAPWLEPHSRGTRPHTSEPLVTVFGHINTMAPHALGGGIWTAMEAAVVVSGVMTMGAAVGMTGIFISGIGAAAGVTGVVTGQGLEDGLDASGLGMTGGGGACAMQEAALAVTVTTIRAAGAGVTGASWLTVFGSSDEVERKVSQTPAAVLIASD
ncbi:unnamed protein product [Cyclocybe aegerita]|uniref:Uncharacterized protein n=1 Tax=Cyclocybe aegerita TaxID=1973307 RepID=A0A8S0WTD7_CYCAE|nr:unnamed protein product [Cyclocybe aegerita]